MAAATGTGTKAREHELDDVLVGLSGTGMYRNNAFRVTGLPVTATAAQIRRRREEALLAAQLGAPVVPTSDLAPHPPPDLDALNAAFEALRHPVVRLVHELLWLWSPGDGAEEHDHVVRRHCAVLEGPPLSASGDPGPADDPRTRQWLVAVDEWAELLAGERLWDYALRRVREIDDPRLTTGTVRRLRDRLPRHVVTVTAGLAVRAAEHLGGDAADRYLWVLDESSFDDDLVDATLTELTRPLVDRVRALCTTADNATKTSPGTAVDAGRLLLDQAGTPLRVLGGVLGADDPTTRTACDQVARSVNLCAVAQYNETSSVRGALPLLARAAELATEQTTVDTIVENRSVLDADVVVGRVQHLVAEGKVNQAAARLRAWRRRTDDDELKAKITDVLADPQALATPLRRGAPTNSLFWGIGMVLVGRRKARQPGRYVATHYLMLGYLLVFPVSAYLRDEVYVYGKVPMSPFVRFCQLLIPVALAFLVTISLPPGQGSPWYLVAVLLAVGVGHGQRAVRAAVWAAKQTDD